MGVVLGVVMEQVNLRSLFCVIMSRCGDLSFFGAEGGGRGGGFHGVQGWWCGSASPSDFECVALTTEHRIPI